MGCQWFGAVVALYHVFGVTVNAMSDRSGMARFYGQFIEISLNQCHVYIHPFCTEYIPVMYNKRCSMQRYASKRCSIKLKDVR